MNFIIRGEKFILITTGRCIRNLQCSRTATTAGTAASKMMMNIKQKRETGNQRATTPKVRIYRNRRKNLTRAEKLDPETADWPSIFAVARSFNPAVIPLPIRMGRPRPNKVGDIPPPAHGNIELLKIPNFFHLTPPAIKKHCEALKPFCTPWPSDLKDKPIRIVTNNYLYAGPSLRHPESKIVTLKVFLKDLHLDEHARMKMILLTGPERYCKNTDELSLIGDRCPTRKQNRDYVLYLLAALYQESWKTEPWEVDIPKDVNPHDLQKMVADLLKLPIKGKKKVASQRIQRRVVGDKVIRFNRHGKAFIVENYRHGIIGPPTKQERSLYEQEWKKIKP